MFTFFSSLLVLQNVQSHDKTWQLLKLMNSDDFIVKGKYQETRTIRRKCNNKKKKSKRRSFFFLCLFAMKRSHAEIPKVY